MRDTERGQMTVQVVDREFYTIPVAARILRMPTSTLRWSGHDACRPGHERTLPSLRSTPTPHALVGLVPLRRL